MGFFSNLLNAITGNTTSSVLLDLFKKDSSVNKYKQAETSYAETVAVKATPQLVKGVLDACMGLEDDRRIIPPDYTEYITYDHRSYLNNVRIGDVSFSIPPEFISVIDSSPSLSTSMIRQSGTIKSKPGYSRKEISLPLYFNGLNQINGYKVKGPIGDYYVDGLRPLLAQFMVSPYVPIVNDLINNQHGIYNVALNNIMVSTLEGYPHTLEVTLIMTEVSLTPYIEMPDVIFHDMIDWDLFRFNYQRLMRKDKTSNIYLPPIKQDGLSDLTLEQINIDALSGNNLKNNDIFDNDNFTSILSTKTDKFYVSNISFDNTNIIPLVQLSNSSTPCSQYMGRGDTNITITINTSDESIVGRISGLNTYIQFLSKQYKEYGTFGFIKIKNQLIQMAGVEYVVLDKISYSTVPGFPGLHQITLQCISFDFRQKERESIIGMLPFPEDMKGEKSDAITQDSIGIVNKISQDTTIEDKISKLEMYPDLNLPLYSEVDEYITKVNEFRAENNLERLNYTKFPRSYSTVPNKGIYGSYNVFVDPDYYVFYPVKYSEIEDDVFDTFKGCENMTPVSTIGRSVEYGDEIPDGFIYDADGNLVSVNKGKSDSSSSTNSTVYTAGETNNKLANLLIQKANQGCGYVWGADGQMYSASVRKTMEGKFGASNYNGTEKWYGKQVFDCSGLICWGLRELGIAPSGYRVNNRTLFNQYCTTISKSELKPGDIVNKGSEHIGVYIGDGKTVEAMNTQKGVVIGTLGNRYTEYGRIKSDLSTGSSNNTSTSGTSGASTSESYLSESHLNKFLKNNLANTAKYYIQSANKYGLNPAFTVALSCQETGWGTASAIKSHNNPGGIMDWDNNWKTLRRFNTLADGIDYVHKNLYNTYISQGLTTIEQIGAKYAPIGAANDPSGLNSHWIPNITSVYKDITGESTVKVTLSGVNISTSSASSSSYVYNRSENAGVVYGNKVKDMNTTDFGKPIFKASPVNSLLIEDKISNGVSSSVKFIFNSSIGIYTDTDMYSSIWIIESLGTALANTVGFLVSDSINSETGGATSYNSAVKRWTMSEEETMNTMYSDMTMYNHRGRLSRAFPTYLLLIADDAGDWLDGRKLWSNYYLYKSVIDISIHQERNQPAHTAKLSITNIHHNLNGKCRANEIKERIENDKEYSSLVRWIYKKTGSLLGTPKLTSTMVDVKNTLYDVINIKPGLNIHIRLGYGSNPIMYPIVFNGIVTDLNIGDTVEMVAQSYGLELVNSILSTKENETNSTTNFGSEPSNVIVNVLTKREGTFRNYLNKKWGEGSKYGIEHFGLPRSNKLNSDKKEYDLTKNIYYGKYKCKMVVQDSILNFDGEDNSNYYLYNKTPWDIFQYVTQTLPEFVCQPAYHQFECRLFFGLPSWLNRYRYDIVNGVVTETAKTFSQFHYIDSMSDIIDNQIYSTSEYLHTNCVAMYTLGGTVKSAPTVYSDRSIYTENQKTKVIDTTLEQDYIGPDWLYEKLGAPVAKSAAIKMAISNLIESWNNVYQGEIIIIGDATIKPCDIIMINDMYSTINGLCGVREVVHSMSHNGFTTSITPDLIALNNQKNSGMGNIYKSLISFGVSYGAVKGVRYTSIISSTSFDRTVSISRCLGSIASLKNDNATMYNALMGLGAIRTGRLLMDSIKTGKVIKGFETCANAFKSILAGIEGINGLKTISTGIKAGKAALTTIGTAACPGIGTAVAWVIGTIVFDMILGAIIDEFGYNNSISVFPLTYKNEPLISGAKGHTKLIPGVTEGDEEVTVGITDEELEKDNSRNSSVE